MGGFNEIIHCKGSGTICGSEDHDVGWSSCSIYRKAGVREAGDTRR
jgi:hypothetical protein